MVHQSDYIVPVQAMEPPCTLEKFYGFVWTIDLGYGVRLTKEQCLRLIDWWENKGGKQEYGHR